MLEWPDSINRSSSLHIVEDDLLSQAVSPAAADVGSSATWTSLKSLPGERLAFDKRRLG